MIVIFCLYCRPYRYLVNNQYGLKGEIMDALDLHTFVAPTEDELMAEQPDTLYLSVDCDDELANDIIILK